MLEHMQVQTARHRGQLVAVDIELECAEGTFHTAHLVRVFSWVYALVETEGESWGFWLDSWRAAWALVRHKIREQHTFLGLCDAEQNRRRDMDALYAESFGDTR